MHYLCNSYIITLKLRIFVFEKKKILLNFLIKKLFFQTQYNFYKMGNAPCSLLICDDSGHSIKFFNFFLKTKQTKKET